MFPVENGDQAEKAFGGQHKLIATMLFVTSQDSGVSECYSRGVQQCTGTRADAPSKDAIVMLAFSWLRFLWTGETEHDCSEQVLRAACFSAYAVVAAGIGSGALPLTCALVLLSLPMVRITQPIRVISIAVTILRKAASSQNQPTHLHSHRSGVAVAPCP